jgi:translocator protein
MKRVLWLIGSLALCFAVAFTGGLATAEGVREWYPTLDKPPWTPPDAAFGPIWTFLYAAMAVAAWDVARRAPRAGRPALALFLVQLALNALWSPVFFAWQETGLALAVISALWAAILACLVAFWRHSRLAAALMVPYLAWVSAAWTLNAWIWWFNP